MNELKPCPYCGSEAMLIDRGYVSSSAMRRVEYHVKCLECACMTIPFDCADKAVAVWNRRAE